MWLPQKIKVYALAAAGVITALGYAYLKGRTDGSLTKENERLQDYADTRKSIDLAEDDITGAGSGREWLLQRKR